MFCFYVFCVLFVSRHAQAHLIILINDKYDLPFSIKDDEHDRRAAKRPQVPNVYPKPEDRFPGAAEFSQMMLNSGNKVRLQKLVKEVLKTQVGQVQGDIIYCEGEVSTNLSTGVANGDYVFKHTEADTILLCLCKGEDHKLHWTCCSRLWRHRRVCPSSLRLATNQG